MDGFLNTLINEISNVGCTILVVIGGILLVRWLDKNVFNNKRQSK